MKCKPDTLGMTGLLFFGSMSSSNFHEIKNALAIINENAGLIEDMVDGDAPIDAGRLKDVAAKINRQVKRTDEIIQTINRFSHSVENPMDRIDLGETAGFVAKLSQRLAAVKGITVRTAPADAGILIRTSPFFLENLIWLCLDFAMGVAGEGKTVELIPEETPEGGRIRFARLEDLENETFEDFISEKERILLSALEADIAADPEAGELIISLPRKLQRDVEKAEGKIPHNDTIKE